jgi:EmrB/QacA subfamily drug resistance transporter
LDSTAAATKPPAADTSGERRYRAIALIVVVMGVTMSGVDTTAVVLGLPVMMRDLHSNIISMIWVIMAYLLVITILGTQFGRLGDMFGRVRMYNFGFAFFSISSLLCGVSSTGDELILFRVLQGIGGAFISSNSGAVIADTFKPAERGKAYGFTGIGWTIGAVLGILVGGAFVTFLNWRYIFFINLPIGLIGTLVGYVKLRERSPKIKRRLDYLGMSLLGAGLFFALYALTEIAGFGFTLDYGIYLAAGAAILVGFALWERRTPEPLIQASLLRERIFGFSLLAAFLQSLTNLAVLFLVIMYLQGPRAMTPFDASLLLVPSFVVGGVVSPFSGRLSDKLGARVVASIGLAVLISGFAVYYLLGTSSSDVLVVLGAVLTGIGSSSFYPANNSAIMSAATPQTYGIASGLLQTLSNIGMVCSFALALVRASLSIPRQGAFQIFLGVGGISPQLAQPFITGLHSALLVAILILVVALVFSALRGKEKRTMMGH